VSQATTGDVETAFDTLEELAAADLTEKQRVDLDMVRGAIEYNSDQFQEALQTFNNVLSYSNESEITSLTLEKATWYLANTQLQLGMTDQAKVNMQRVVDMDGSFSRVAQQKLERI
jgi:outer membrane PBP1 activator LpoA protein